MPFLSRATPEGRARLAGRSSSRELSRGEFLFHLGDPVTRLYVIVSGRVAATVSSTQGTPLLFHVATAGETPGHADLLDGHAYTASAQALSPARVLALPARACLELLEDEPAVLLAYARGLAWIVHQLTDSMADLVFLDLEQRLAHTLAEAAVDDCGCVTLHDTQAELAARLGVARQSLNQALGRLAGRGLVTVESPRRIRIGDRLALEAFVASPPR